MEQRVSFITVAVDDLDAARRFYVDGLGWSPTMDVPGEVLMIRVDEHLVLSFWDRRGFEAELGATMRGEGVAPITLAHNLATKDEVDSVLVQAAAAGASRVFPAQERDWGGYSGYFADPNGYRWEIAYNPQAAIADIVLPRD